MSVETIVADVWATINAQLSTLNWLWIISGVGLAEALVKKAKKGKEPLSWLVPIMVGFVFGLGQYVSTASWVNLITYIFGSLSSILTYTGFIMFVYVFIRPVKYVGDWLKSKSGGAGAQ